jgi:hypothetical protein
MPKIRTYEQRTQLSGGPLGGGATRNPAADAQFVTDLGNAAQKIQLSRDSWRLADTSAKAMGELEQYRGELEADEDFDTHGTRYLEKARELQEKYGGTLSGDSAHIFRQDFERVAQSNATTVQIDAQKLKSQKVRSEIGNTLFDLSQLTGTDEATDQAVRAQARIAVETSQRAGNLSFAEKNALLTKFDTDASEASIRRDMLADPEGAEIKLARGDYPRLSGESQAIWAQRVSSAAYTAQQRRLAEEDRTLRLSDKAKKQRSDALSKQGDALLSQNQLTPAWIHAHTDDLDPNDVRYFYSKLTGGSGDAPRDSMRYADLRERSGRGDDVRDDARKALHEGAIRPTDYDRILGEVEAARPTWYRRGSEYISTYAAVSELNPDPSAAASKANMLDQWNDWANAHPKASETEAKNSYQDIVEHNSLVQLNGLPTPREAVGSRLNLDIDASEAATVKAFKEGRMDPATFQREAALLSRWRKALTPPAKAKP